MSKLRKTLRKGDQRLAFIFCSYKIDEHVSRCSTDLAAKVAFGGFGGIIGMAAEMV